MVLLRFVCIVHGHQKHYLRLSLRQQRRSLYLTEQRSQDLLVSLLYLDVATTLREAGMNDVVLVGGRYGLGSKDTPPSSVFRCI